MKIVVLDGYTLNPGDLSWESFEALGELTIYDRTPMENDIIAERIGDAAYVFTNKTPVNAEIIAACPSLKYIGVLATGYNVVDVVAAKKAGITVTNIPTYGTDAVGQFAFALLLEICHHVGHHSRLSMQVAGKTMLTGVSGITSLNLQARPWGDRIRKNRSVHRTNRSSFWDESPRLRYLSKCRPCHRHLPVC